MRAAGAVTHSGDLLRHSMCEGSHTITVELASLSPAVRELYISMSAYCGLLKVQALCGRPRGAYFRLSHILRRPDAAACVT